MIKAFNTFSTLSGLSSSLSLPSFLFLFFLFFFDFGFSFFLFPFFLLFFLIRSFSSSSYDVPIDIVFFSPLCSNIIFKVNLALSSKGVSLITKLFLLQTYLNISVKNSSLPWNLGRL